MPSPVLALPWGSRSIRSTRFSIAASAVARLIAVVVLPTPPFWLAIAITRGRRATGAANSGPVVGSAGADIGSGRTQGGDAHDDAIGVDDAGQAAHVHCPGFLGQRQFASPVAALVEQPDRGGPEKPLREPEQR